MTTISEDVKFEVLNDHYKDTFLNIKDSIKLRDRFFFCVLVTITPMLYQIYSPQNAGDAISDLVAQILKLQNSIDLSFISSLLWFTLLGIVVRYFQMVVYIERQYDYIHRLEAQLNEYFNDTTSFTREGKFYLDSYPEFSNWVWFLYTIVFPIMLVIFIMIKVINDWNIFPLATTIINSLIAIAIIISIALYICMVHFKK